MNSRREKLKLGLVALPREGRYVTCLAVLFVGMGPIGTWGVPMPHRGPIGAHILIYRSYKILPVLGALGFSVCVGSVWGSRGHPPLPVALF